MRVAIIGGGLAGAACAFMLNRAGVQTAIYEAGADLGAGASGNEVGLYNPRFTAEFSPAARLHASAFKLALEVFEALSDIDWDPCGALHLVNNEQRARRYLKTVVAWGRDMEMRMVNAEEASEIAGVSLSHKALYLPRSGSVSPRKLCNALSSGYKVYLNSNIRSLDDLDADAVILANGMGVLAFPQADLRLKAVRGQITFVKENDSTRNLKCNLCYGGYMTRARNGVHAVGASFQRWLDHTDILPEDDMDNIQKLAQVSPDLAAGVEVVGHRAGVRAVVPDHLPYIGRLPGERNVYVSAGHGSHGILTSLAGAQILADMILGKGQAQDSDVTKAIAPGRFIQT